MKPFIERPFEKIGARVKLQHLGDNEFRGPVRLDVQSDRKGEFFLICAADNVRVEILDCRPDDRHLLLLARILGERRVEKPRFLMGHDERHWFVAAVPESSPVSTVEAAKQALKPDVVLKAEQGLRRKEKHLRANKGRTRQGEWFFVPVPDLKPNPLLVLRDEPLRRSGGKPHMAEELFRTGGRNLYFSSRNSNGVSEATFRSMPESIRSKRQWRTMRVDMRAFVRGRIRHSDHATVFLDGWHEVFMNTEFRSRAMQNVVFLD